MFVAGTTFGSRRVSCEDFFMWVPIMRLNVQSSAQGWTYFGSLREVLSVEPDEL